MKKFYTYLLALLGLNCAACNQPTFENVSVEGFAPLTVSPNAQLVDVRTEEEFAADHIAGAANIDINADDFLKTSLAQLDKSKTIAVYCRSGRRSANAAQLLAKEGYRVTNLEGGILAWEEKGMPVTKDAHERDIFMTPNGKTVEVYALMHASIRIAYNGKEFFVDPVSQLGDQVVDYSHLPKADYILVTHEHGDHFNPETIQNLLKADTRIITNRRCADMLQADMPQAEVMGNGDKIALTDDISIEATPAYNTTEGHLQFHPQGRDNGFVLTIDGLRIYIAGDTEDIPEMASLSDQDTPIDIAFLPCNQPYTMTTEQLIRAARMVRPRNLFPYHYGQTDVTSLPAQLQADSIAVLIRHYE